MRLYNLSLIKYNSYGYNGKLGTDLVQKPRNTTNPRETRRLKLTKALGEAGLVLRSDSKYCWKYINSGSGKIDEIVHRMCEMKFLFEYTDMREELKRVSKGQEEELEAGYFPDCSVFDEAEDNIIRKTPYPEIFPWQI
jgi:hypothetical protein